MSRPEITTDTTFKRVVDELNLRGTVVGSDEVLAVKDWNARREEYLNGVGENDDADRRVFTEELIARLEKVEKNVDMMVWVSHCNRNCRRI